MSAAAPSYQLTAKIKGDNADLKAKVREAKEETRGLRTTIAADMKNIASTALGFLTGSAVQQGIGFLVGGFKDLIGEGIDFNATMEDLQASFTTLLHNSGAARQMLSDLYALSSKTPFQFQDLAQAASEMLAMGFKAKDIIPDLKAIGDAAASLPGGIQENTQKIILALGQMQAKTKVSAEEMNQLTEAGIPAWDILSKKMGIPVAQLQKMAEQGKLNAKPAVDALLSSFEQLYGGGMQRKSETFNGLISNLKDNLSSALGVFTAPIFQKAKEDLEKVGDLLSSKGFKDFASGVGKGVADTFDRIGQFAGKLKEDFLEAFDDKNGEKVKKLKELGADLLDKLKELGNWAKDHLKDALEGVAEAAGHLVSWLADLKQHVKEVQDWWSKWGGYIEVAGIALATFFTPAIIKAGIESAITNAKLAQGLIISIISSGNEAIKAAGKFWYDPISFVKSIGKTGEAAQANAAKVEVLTAAEQTAGEQATQTAAQQDALAASEELEGNNAVAASAKLEGLAAAEKSAGAAAEGATGAGAAASLGVGGVLGLAGAMFFLAGLADQASHSIQDWYMEMNPQPIRDMSLALEVLDQNMVNLADGTNGTAGAVLNFENKLAIVNDFFLHNPLLHSLNDLRNILLNIVDAEGSAADYAHRLNEEWAKLHVPNLGNWTPENPPYQPGGGHPHAQGGYVGPREMLSLINDEGGRGELVQLPSGSYVYPHRQSVTLLQQMQRQQPVQQTIHNHYYTFNAPTSEELIQELRRQEQRRAVLYGG